MKDLRELGHSPVGRALLALLLMMAIGALFNADGAFFRWSVHRDMLRQVSVYGILACGMTVVILTAGIDLSVSSVLAFSAGRARAPADLGRPYRREGQPMG